MESIKKYLVAGIGVAILIILSNMFISYQNRKIEEQQRKIIEVQAKNPKIIYKSAKEKIVYQDRVIEKKIYTATNGTVITEEKETIKDRIIEKEVIKETKIPVYTDTKKDSLWIGLSVVHIDSRDDLIGIKVSYCNSWAILSAGYYRDFEISEFAFDKIKNQWRQTFSVDLSIKLLEF